MTLAQQETPKDEARRVDAIAAQSRYSEGVHIYSMEHSFKVFCRLRRPGAILELGPAEGLMTDKLAGLGEKLVVVEGAEKFCTEIKARHPQTDVVCALFEEYAPKQKFPNIVLGHVLEHVDDPVGLLKRIKEWLTEDGRLFTVVPNARSLHRQLGVLMGLLPVESHLHELDIHHGHRRVYDPESFRAAFLAAGMTVEAFGGYFTKILSNRQMSESFTPEMIEASMVLGERYPDIAAEIYVVASR